MKKIILTFAIFFISLVGFGQLTTHKIFFAINSETDFSVDGNDVPDHINNINSIMYVQYTQDNNILDTFYIPISFFMDENIETIYSISYWRTYFYNLLENIDEIHIEVGTIISYVGELGADFHIYVYDDVSSISENVVTDLRVYPNPSTDYINIDFNSHNEVSITIYSIDGKVMYNTNTYQSETINIQDYPKGMYIVRVNDEMKKIIKQ